ncbi:hypothetical protein [Paenibacillus periandrae]|nr:hypothetical protein [Paenibacillus periandrae]
MYKWTMAGILGIACLLGLGVLFTDINNRQGEAKQEVTAPKMPEAPMNA